MMTLFSKSRFMCMGLLLASGMLFSAFQGTEEERVSVTERPFTEESNVNYTSNRAPLKPLQFIKLPVGSVQPEGWLRKYLELQRDGLTGHLGEISAWLEKKDNAWLTSGGQHGWEEVPYWLKGYGNLAYILRDEKMIAETKVWLEGVFKSVQPDGYFGPVNEKDGRRELWANMIMLWCMQSYYEYSGDQRVIDLMTNYFKWQLTVDDSQFLKDYWENSRGGDNLWSVYWLYNITGDSFLLDLAEKIHRCTADWTMDSRLPNWHNVNIAQCFREPATYYLLSGDSAHLAASYNVHDLVRRCFGQVPGGMFGADENARMGCIDPRQGTETCGFVEEMASDELMMRITGDPKWADQCEDVAFNSYPAAVMPDFKALRYITFPNQVLSDAQNHQPGIDNGGPFLAMNPFSSRCCQHNHAQGWPYYTEHMVMATPDNGVVAALYGACRTCVKVGKGTEMILKEETRYPFEETVVFTVEIDQPENFPFYLRIPGWTEQAQVKVNGKRMKVKPEAGSYYRIERTWKTGDRVELLLPMRLTMRTWQVNQNSVSVNYGPLTLSLKIGEEYIRKDSRETAIWDSKWQQGADAGNWPSYEIHPTTPWNYALVLGNKDPLTGFEVVKKAWPADNFPFTSENVPLEVKARGCLVPSWKIDRYGLCAVLPTEDTPRSSVVETITLIPMGAARLRISAFPPMRE